MFSYKKLLTIVGIALCVSSCTRFYGERGLLKDRENDYLKAQNIAPMRIPPGYNSDTIQAHFPVSYKQYPTSPRIDLTPPG